jgi:hypothetical protein
MNDTIAKIQSALDDLKAIQPPNPHIDVAKSLLTAAVIRLSLLPEVGGNKPETGSPMAGTTPATINH